MGASQIKLMAGGGTSSEYDPIDVTQYTLDVRRAIEAGVKCVEHGRLLDESTIQPMAQKGIWLRAQNLIPDSPNLI
jgi:imidazolonepropionase-like amidohydrolase